MKMEEQKQKKTVLTFWVIATLFQWKSQGHICHKILCQINDVNSLSVSLSLSIYVMCVLLVCLFAVQSFVFLSYGRLWHTFEPFKHLFIYVVGRVFFKVAYDLKKFKTDEAKVCPCLCVGAPQAIPRKLVMSSSSNLVR